MPRITKIRIVGNRYDNFKKHHQNSIFDLTRDGEPDHTLFTLKNGSGKGVMMQLISQLILPGTRWGSNNGSRVSAMFYNRYRNFIPYTFHVMLEWKLDTTPERWLVAGICFTANKRNLGNNEEEEERVALQYFLYTMEHNNNGPFTLENIPTYDRSRKRVASYEQFERFINDNKKYFRKYSRSATRRTNSEYYQYLKSNGIYRSEWEIMKLINKAEGGMGEYFARSSDNKAIFDNLIIPAVSENMYNQSEEYRDALKEIFRSNLTITRKLPVLLAREEDYRSLLIMLEPLIEDARTGLAYEKRLQDSVDLGNNLYQTFSNIIKTLEEEKKKAEEQLSNLTTEKKRLAFERDNIEFARKHREFKRLEKEIADNKKQVETLEAELVQLKEEREKYEINQLTIPMEKAVRTRGNKIKLKETLLSGLDIRELKDEMGVLEDKIAKEWRNTSARWTALTEKHTAYLENLTGKEKELKRKRDSLQDKIQRLEVEVRSFEKNLEVHEKWERELAEDFNPLQLQAPEMLLNNLKEEQARGEKKKKELIDRINLLNKKMEELKADRLKNEFELKQLKEEIEDLIARYDARKEEEEAHFQQVVRALQLDGLKEVYQESWLCQKVEEIAQRIEKKEERLTAFQKEVWENNIDLSLNEGDFWLANNDLHLLYDKINQTGVKVEYGSRFLSALPEDERKEIMVNFPLLSYGLIILQEKDREIIDNNLSGDFFLRSAVPIFIRSAMSSSDRDKSFTLVDNKAAELVLDDKYFQEWKEGLANKKSQLLETVSSVRKNLDFLRELINESRELLKKDSSHRLKQQAEELRLKQVNFETKGKELAGQIGRIEEELVETARRRDRLESELAQKRDSIKIIEEFISAKERLETKKKEISQIRNVIKDYREEEAALLEELEIIADNFKEEEIDFRSWKRQVESALKDIREVIAEASLKISDSTKTGSKDKPHYTEPDSGDIFLLLNKRKLINSKLEEKNMQIGIVNNEIKHLDEKINNYRKDLLKKNSSWKEYRIEGITLSVVERRLTNIEKKLVEREESLKKAAGKVERLRGRLEAVNENIREIGKRIESKYYRSALLWEEENLDVMEIKISQASEKNLQELEELEQSISSIQDDLFKLKNHLAVFNGFNRLDKTRGRTDQKLLRKIRQNPEDVLENWMREFHELEKMLENQQQEAGLHFEQFLQDLKSEVNEEMLRTKLRESFGEGLNASNFGNNLESFISMREHFTKELNSLKQDKLKAEEAREQWANRASMQVIKIIESLKEMVGKMVYLNQNGHAFPLVRLRRGEQLPREEEDVKFILKEYFLECIEEINKAGLEGSSLTDRELEKYMGDQAIFSRAVRGRYPVLEVYKMTEKNEFLYARPRDYNYTSWEAINKGEGDDPEGSGGQTLSINTFVIMMLLNFRKKTISNENPWTVLMLDNPFGKASAEHVLDPIFEIADKLNFQIIAFAAPEIIKTEISERFPVFWALKIGDSGNSEKEGAVTGQVIHGGRVRKVP